MKPWPSHSRGSCRANLLWANPQLIGNKFPAGVK
jgi:hypothetical protein